MKIISKFQDYYDIGIAYGIDEKLRFERVSEVVSDKRVYGAERYVVHRFRRENQRYVARFYYNHIVFCGKIYPFIHLRIDKVTKKEKHLYCETVHDFHLYDMEDLAETLQRYAVAGEEIKLSSIWTGIRWRKRDVLEASKQFFMDRESHKLLFEMYKQPYFVVEHYFTQEKEPAFMEKVTLLAQLKAYRFAKAVPPMQAFQEISMYLGQLDQAEDNTVSIEDKHLALGKGFGCYSFRKMPSKRKAKPC